MDLYDEFFRVSRGLASDNVGYAVVGGIALAFHGAPRFTRDIDILVLPEDLASVESVLEEQGYSRSGPALPLAKAGLTMHGFVTAESEDHLVVNVFSADTEAQREVVERALHAESQAGPVRLAQRDDLIQMKRHRNSAQDRADIESLRQ